MSVFNRLPRIGADVKSSLPQAPVLPSAPPVPPRSYADARSDALTTCQVVGVDLDGRYSDSLSVADLVTLAYAAGLKAGEARLAEPDIADAIAGAIGSPGGILERNVSESPAQHVVRAVQQVVAYGVPK